MKKAVKKKKVKVISDEIIEIIPKEPVITPVEVDFGREDLNNLARKVNELIALANK